MEIFDALKAEQNNHEYNLKKQAEKERESQEREMRDGILKQDTVLAKKSMNLNRRASKVTEYSSDLVTNLNRMITGFQDEVQDHTTRLQQMELEEIKRLAQELAKTEYRATHLGKDRGYFKGPKMNTMQRKKPKMARMTTVDKDVLDATFYLTSAADEQKLWEEKIAIGIKNEQDLMNKDEHFRLKAQIKNRGLELKQILLK